MYHKYQTVLTIQNLNKPTWESTLYENNIYKMWWKSVETSRCKRFYHWKSQMSRMWKCLKSNFFLLSVENISCMGIAKHGEGTHSNGFSSEEAMTNGLESTKKKSIYGNIFNVYRFIYKKS